MAQHILMVPAEEDNQTIRDWGINSWKERILQQGFAFLGDPRNWEQTKHCASFSIWKSNRLTKLIIQGCFGSWGDSGNRPMYDIAPR